jgi:hypothetical protein
MKPKPITLTVQNVGHVPSFKNSKMILWKQRRIMTKPENQHWMESVVRSFVSQLSSEFQTRGIEITTAHTALLRIALSLPLDDSRKWIPEFSVRTQIVSIGNEGADILIERIDTSEPKND